MPKIVRQLSVVWKSNNPMSANTALHRMHIIHDQPTFDEAMLETSFEHAVGFKALVLGGGTQCGGKFSQRANCRKRAFREKIGPRLR